MKVLSILQPWASLVVTKDPKTGKAYKQIETRSWNTKYRGPLLIHASQKITQWKCWPAGMNTELNILYRDGVFDCEKCPTGAIIGMVTLIDTFKMGAVWGMIEQNMKISIGGREVNFSEQEIAFGDYSTGRYGWLLSDPILFKTPIPCKGNLSIWNLPVELEWKVWQEIYAAKGQAGMVAIIYHTKEYQRKSVHYTAELGTDRAEDLIRQTTELINKMGDDSRYSIQYFSKEEYDNITELVAGTASSEKVHVSGSCHIPESAYQPTLIATPGEGAVVVEGVKGSRFSPQFIEAAKLVVEHQAGSVSLLQRRMKMGYNRACDLMVQLEALGIVGPILPTKVRDVLVKSLFELELLLESKVAAETNDQPPALPLPESNPKEPSRGIVAEDSTEKLMDALRKSEIN